MRKRCVKTKLFWSPGINGRRVKWMNSSLSETATVERANFRMFTVPLLYVHRLASAIVVCFLYIRLLKVQDLNSFVQRPANKIKREML